MQIKWKGHDTWKCPKCGYRKCFVINISEYWVDVECLNCEQQDGILFIDFKAYMELEVNL